MIAILAMLAALAAPHPARMVPRRPNVVFVLADDLSSDLVRRMPAVQALARRGASFSNYIVDDSLCCPSRASIFTGRLPHDTGVFTNVAPDGGAYAWRRHRDEQHAFAGVLRARGYRTALMGKYLNGYRADGGHVPPGWTRWAGTGKGYEGFGYALDEDGVPRSYGTAPGDYLTDVIARLGERFIGRRPFFLELATFAPHRPAVPAPRDASRFPGARAPRTPAYDRQIDDAPPWLAHRAPFRPATISRIDRDYRQRARSVVAVDRLLQGVEDRLQRLGELDDTYVVFSSDNGYHLGDHRLLPGKFTAFDTDVRVPLIVAGPGIRPGTRIDALAQNTDLAPTFEQMAGAPVPIGTDGRSLLGLLRGRPVPRDWRRVALIEHHHPPHGRHDPDHQSGESGDPPTYEAIRTRGETYVEYADGERESYDDRIDPFQLRNRYSTLRPRHRRALHRELRRLARCHGAGRCATSSAP